MLYLQALLHPRGMQNLALMHALAPAARRLHPEGARRLVAAHVPFFNCNPNFAPLVAGGILRLERERLAGRPITDQDVAHFKRALSSPLAAMGDMLFLGAIEPLALTLGCLSGIYNSFTGLVLAWLLYNAVVVTCRLWGVFFGYERGWELVDVFSGPAFQRILGIVQSIGASVGGALVAVLLYRASRYGLWALVATMVLVGTSLATSRRDVSPSRLSAALLPLCVLVALAAGS